MRCQGCHSKDSWNPKAGDELNHERLVIDINRYAGWITCVLFMGGEWEVKNLIILLNMCRTKGLKTALYTGLDKVDPKLMRYLDYLKTGPYRAEFGGLDVMTTNQKLINVNTGEVLNRYMTMPRGAYDDTFK